MPSTVYLFKQWNEKYDEMSLVSVVNIGRTIVMIQSERQKHFVLFILCTEAETGYFGGRQAVKGEESQYGLTEAFCLFWAHP